LLRSGEEEMGMQPGESTGAVAPRFGGLRQPALPRWIDLMMPDIRWVSDEQRLRNLST
jgi:hypothetical protein